VRKFGGVRITAGWSKKRKKSPQGKHSKIQNQVVGNRNGLGDRRRFVHPVTRESQSRYEEKDRGGEVKK